MLSPTRPGHVLHAGNKPVLSREEESDKKDSCSEKLRGKNFEKALGLGFSLPSSQRKKKKVTLGFTRAS